MANTSSILAPPAPITVLSSTKLTGPGSVQDAKYTSNWLIGRGGCTPLVDQGWDGVAFTWAGAAQVGPTWWIPNVSGAHLTVDVVVRYTKTVGAGQIRALSVGAAAAVAAAAPVAAAAEVTLAGLTIAAGGDEVQLEVTSAAGSITIHDVYIEPPYLADPLPAAAVDGASPMGVGTGAADYPHTARDNADLLTNLPILRVRPRVIACWSGLDPAVGQETLRSGMRHRTLTRTWHGSVAQGVTYSARAYVRNTTGAAQRLIWQAGDLRWERPTWVVPVAAGFTGYKVTDIVLPDEILLPGYPWEACAVGLDTTGAYATTCEVLRYTITGE